MLDCGICVGRQWYPSTAYNGQHINTLMLMNLDEDHCEDLPYLIQNCGVGALVSNPTVDVHALRSMKKECGMRNGVTTAANVLARFGPGFLGDWSHDLGGVAWRVFWNSYGAEFTDTNNLSLATFVDFGAFTILFGGDLERAGWRRLLQIPLFREKLRTVNVYVASHHGRENGCCSEVFDICRPEVVIFSDGRKQYETQETSDWYASRTKGIPDYTRPVGLIGEPAVRKVMTTRRDGTIAIHVATNGRYSVMGDRLMRLPGPSGLPTRLSAW